MLNAFLRVAPDARPAPAAAGFLRPKSRDIGAMRQPYSRKSIKLMTRICNRIANGATLQRVCEGEAFPNLNSVYAWCRADPEFKAMYEAACEKRASRKARKEAKGPPKPRVHDTYSLEVAERICDRIVAGAAVCELADAPDLPCVRTIYTWIDKHEEFRTLHNAACRVRADMLADEILRIADDDSRDLRPSGKDGAEMVPNVVRLHRARMEIDARKWRFASLAPKPGAGRRKESDEPRPITLEEALLQLELEGEFDLPQPEE